jgi:hypothetical protein
MHIATPVLVVVGCEAETALPVSSEPDLSHDGGQRDVRAKMSSDAMVTEASQPADSRSQMPDGRADGLSESAASDEREHDV